MAQCEAFFWESSPGHADGWGGKTWFPILAGYPATHTPRPLVKGYSCNDAYGSRRRGYQDKTPCRSNMVVLYRSFLSKRFGTSGNLQTCPFYFKSNVGLNRLDLIALRVLRQDWF
jgi:hypothetical protein